MLHRPCFIVLQDTVIMAAGDPPSVTHHPENWPLKNFPCVKYLSDNFPVINSPLLNCLKVNYPFPWWNTTGNLHVLFSSRNVFIIRWFNLPNFCYDVFGGHPIQLSWSWNLILTKFSSNNDKKFLQKLHICRKIDSILFISLLNCVSYNYSGTSVVPFLSFLNNSICICKKFYGSLECI